MSLFERKFEINIAGRLISGLRVAFKGTKSLKADPNTGEISIYNLSDTSKTLLENPDTVIQVSAGYENEITQLFYGTPQEPTTTFSKTDQITTFGISDGGRITRKKRLNVSLKPGASLQNIFDKILKSFDTLKTSDAKNTLKDAVLSGNIKELANGFVSNDNAYREFQNLIKGTQFEASIQDGIIQVLEKGATTSEDAYVISAETGMIGSPAKGEKGLVSVQTLLLPQLYPGRKIQIKSNVIEGEFFRIIAVEFNGDTHAIPWYANIEGVPL